jgi:hypothetical protein
MHVKLVPPTPPYPEVLDWREDLERAEREARELLDEQVKKVEDAGGIVARVHLRKEQPAEEIVALAEELGADLIVVGRRHRGRIRRALAGSVSNWVVRHARCPVLVVGAGGRLADNRARLSRGTWTARSETSKEAGARRLGIRLRDREQPRLQARRLACIGAECPSMNRGVGRSAPV